MSNEKQSSNSKGVSYCFVNRSMKQNNNLEDWECGIDESGLLPDEELKRMSLDTQGTQETQDAFYPYSRVSTNVKLQSVTSSEQEYETFELLSRGEHPSRKMPTICSEDIIIPNGLVVSGPIEITASLKSMVGNHQQPPQILLDVDEDMSAYVSYDAVSNAISNTSPYDFDRSAVAYDRIDDKQKRSAGDGNVASNPYSTYLKTNDSRDEVSSCDGDNGDLDSSNLYSSYVRTGESRDELWCSDDENDDDENCNTYTPYIKTRESRDELNDGESPYDSFPGTRVAKEDNAKENASDDSKIFVVTSDSKISQNIGDCGENGYKETSKLDGTDRQKSFSDDEQTLTSHTTIINSGDPPQAREALCETVFEKLSSKFEVNEERWFNDEENEPTSYSTIIKSGDLAQGRDGCSASANAYEDSATLDGIGGEDLFSDDDHESFMNAATSQFVQEKPRAGQHTVNEQPRDQARLATQTDSFVKSVGSMESLEDEYAAFVQASMQTFTDRALNRAQMKSVKAIPKNKAQGKQIGTSNETRSATSRAEPDRKAKVDNENSYDLVDFSTMKLTKVDSISQVAEIHQTTQVPSSIGLSSATDGHALFGVFEDDEANMAGSGWKQSSRGLLKRLLSVRK